MKNVVQTIGLISWLTCVGLGVSLTGCGGNSPASAIPEEPEGQGIETLEGVSALNLADQAYQEGMNYLKGRRVKEAQLKFDKALTLDKKHEKANFGAALTRILQIIEAKPSTGILNLLGQSGVTVGQFIGTNGYITTTNGYNQTNSTMSIADKAIAGPLFGSANYDTWEDSWGTKTCKSTYLNIEVYDAGKKNALYLGVPLSQESYEGDKLEASYAVKVGTPIEVGSTLEGPCAWQQAVSLSVKKDGTWGGFQASGSIVFKTLNTGLGQAIALETKDVKTQPWGEDPASAVSFTAVIHDKITPFKADQSGLPFYGLNGLKGGNLLAKVKAGATVADFQAQMDQYQPLLSEILLHLSRADKSNSFQFIVPKQLFFGVKDLPFNRADVRALRAGTYYAMAGLALANSWDFALELDTLFDENGNLAVTKQEVVDQLNASFTLKTNHQVKSAMGALRRGLSLTSDTVDLLSAITVDGILEKNADADLGFAEIQEIAEAALASYDGPEPFPFVDAEILMDLKHFYLAPPDANNVAFDPFVVEGGEIQPVEAFFHEMLKGSVDWDTAATYELLLKGLNKDFMKAVFDEFKNFMVAGVPIKD